MQHRTARPQQLLLSPTTRFLNEELPKQTEQPQDTQGQKSLLQNHITMIQADVSEIQNYITKIKKQIRIRPFRLCRYKQILKNKRSEFVSVIEAIDNDILPSITQSLRQSKKLDLVVQHDYLDHLRSKLYVVRNDVRKLLTVLSLLQQIE